MMALHLLRAMGASKDQQNDACIYLTHTHTRTRTHTHTHTLHTHTHTARARARIHTHTHTHTTRITNAGLVDTREKALMTLHKRSTSRLGRTEKVTRTLAVGFTVS